MTNRLLNEAIDIHSRALGWNNWRVTEVAEIFLMNAAGTIIGGLVNANSSGINFRTIPGPSIIVIDSLHLTVELNAKFNQEFYLNLRTSIKFYRYPNKNNVLAQPSSFRDSTLGDSGGKFYYQIDLDSPEVFSLPNNSQIGLDCLLINPTMVPYYGWGKALIITKI